MWRFESLLLKELQRQQSRAQFCDTILQAQGVSVPVHSCVLSAFSPQLSGALSALPAPPPGQSRLIELQAVEACTLLSLVGLLYSGRLEGRRDQLLSAASTLGIRLLPHTKEERGRGGGEQRGARGGGEGGEARAGDEREDGDGTEREQIHGERGEERSSGREVRLQEEAQRERVREGESGGVCEGVRESGTQTECVRTQTEDRETQTDHDITCFSHEPPGPAPSHQQQPRPELPGPPTRLTGPSLSWETDREHATHPHAAASDTTVTSLCDDVTVPPDRVSCADDITTQYWVCDAAVVDPLYVPSPSLLLPQPDPLYLIPPPPLSSTEYTTPLPPQTYTTAPLPPQTYPLSPPRPSYSAEAGPAGMETVAGGVFEGGGEEVEGFEQFEGNIAGFISYFLGPGQSLGEGRRGRGRRRARGGARAEGAERRVRRARGRARDGGGVRGGRAEGGGRGRTGGRRGLAEREGWAVKLAWRGRGGGRIGRKLHLRTKLRKPIRLCLRRPARDALWEVVKERGGCRPRGRSQPHRGAELNEDGSLLVRRLRGRLRIRPLPLPALPRNPPKTPPPPACDPPAPALLHTLPLPPPDSAAQHVDWRLDDFVTREPHPLPCVAVESQDKHSEPMNTVNPSVHLVLETAEPSLPQQPEGEFRDILDHFLWSFERQVGGRGLELCEQSESRCTEPCDQSESRYTAVRNVDGAQSRPYEQSTVPLHTHTPHTAPLHTHTPHTHTLEPFGPAPAGTTALQLPSASLLQTEPQTPSASLLQSEPQIPSSFRWQVPSGCSPGGEWERPSGGSGGEGECETQRTEEGRREEDGECETRRITRSQTHNRKREVPGERGAESVTGEGQAEAEGPVADRKRVKGGAARERERSRPPSGRKGGRRRVRCVYGARKRARRRAGARAPAESECTSADAARRLGVCVVNLGPRHTNTPPHTHTRPVTESERANTHNEPIDAESDTEAGPDRKRDRGIGERERKRGIGGGGKRRGRGGTKAGFRIDRAEKRRRVGSQERRREKDQSFAEDRSVMGGAYLETASSAFEQMRILLERDSERERERETDEQKECSKRGMREEEKREMRGEQERGMIGEEERGMTEGWRGADTPATPSHQAPPRSEALSGGERMVKETYQRVESPQNTEESPMETAGITLRISDLTLSVGKMTRHTPSEKVAHGSPGSLEEEVDVLEASSPAPALPVVLSAEDDDDEEEEIDVIGLD